jgi:hypothetical protein
MDYTEMELQRIEIRLAQHLDDAEANWLINLYRTAEGHDRTVIETQIDEELSEIDRLEEMRLVPDANGNRHYTFKVAGIEYVIWNQTNVLCNGIQVGHMVDGTIQFDAVG